jgi:indolepyruvate ferredoxin oxidoreductase
MASVARAASPQQVVTVQRTPSLDALIRERTELLEAYQDKAWAHRYAELVGRVRERESRERGTLALTRAVAVNLYKLMAYKDEYEVARLYSDGRFAAQLAREFEGQPRLRFHLAPPLLGRRDAQGRPVKTTFGPWMQHMFRVLAKLRRLRGTPFDPFGRTAERRMERALIEDYRAMVEELLARWHALDIETALALAKLPEQIRGFGPVKEESVALARVRWQALRAQLVQARPAGDETADRQPVVSGS